MYEILAGKQRALVFPVMCNGHVKIDYSDNVVDTGGDSSTTNDIAYGLWAHEGSFTFESIITPYEINGHGTYAIARSAPTYSNKKVMPALSQSVYTAGNEGNHRSELYLSRTARLTHEMMIFHNTNFQISLVNSTLHNENNPARYKIRVRLKLGTSTETYTTEEVIVPTTNRFFKYATPITTLPSLFTDSDGRSTHKQVATVSGHSGANLTVSHANLLFGGNRQEVFIAPSGEMISLGTINTLAGPTGSQAATLTTPYSTPISNGENLYIKQEQTAIYTENTFHIACTFNETNRALNIFFNGSLVKTDTHSTDSTFSFAKEDCYIGANGTGSTGAGSATTNKQFMGEIHEMSMMGVRRKEFKGVDSLLPNFDDTLFYFRFEEVDL
jgi:hypothetical protein